MMKEFEGIIGYNDVKAELEKICDIMLNHDKYAKLGVTTPRGLLLHGDPGVGKTTMAKCLINASKRPVFICRKDKPDGDFVKEIKKQFDEAKKSAPSILFLDDMDKFANDDEKHVNSEEFVTVQSCIDDCKGEEVFILATANDLRAIPRSLLRAGRFDKSIKINNPRLKDAEAIIKYYLSQKKFVADVDYNELAKILSGGSCAELETVINEAGVYAGFQNKEKIELDDILRAAMRVIFGAPENLEETDEEDLLRIAYHEAGHAVIAEVLEPNSVSIVSVLSHTGNTGGVTSYNQGEKYWTSKKYMENRVLSLLGGKAATELVYGEVDIGANSDLSRAFSIVERFSYEYCSNSFDRRETMSGMSEALLSRKEMQRAVEMENFYWKAKKILADNREFLDKLARRLVEKKTLLNTHIQAVKADCKQIVA
jgi:cell division protease FtsH